MTASGGPRFAPHRPCVDLVDEARNDNPNQCARERLACARGGREEGPERVRLDRRRVNHEQGERRDGRREDDREPREEARAQARVCGVRGGACPLGIDDVERRARGAVGEGREHDRRKPHA